MNWLDVILLIVLGWSIFASFRKGLMREVVGLASVVLAIVLGCWFYGTAAGFLSPYFKQPWLANLLGFLIVLGGVLALGAAVSFIIGKFLKVTGLSILDHVLGAGFGALRGVLISVALIMGIMAFSPADHPPESVVRSRTAPYIVDASRFLSKMTPYELKEGFRRSYDQVKNAWGKAIHNGLPGAPGAGKDNKGNERAI
jgi:membrane protein required for colicin V production